MATSYNPNCERARELLVIQQVTPQSKHLPRGSISYFPRSSIIKVLEKFPVQDVFSCACARCRHHADLQGDVDNREGSVDESELLGRYATIFGLLIYLRYPALIAIFLRYETPLVRHLNDGDLEFLNNCNALTTIQVQIIRREILEHQHRFHVREFFARKTITTIDEREILPITEDAKPVGKGDFGEVYSFRLHDEYMHESWKSHEIKRYARKIFDRRWTQANTAKEWVNHLYVNKLKHENLMEALAAYDYGNYFFIVSELAQCTLWDFLLGLSSVSFTSQKLWIQVHGLTSGLAYLHGQSVTGERWKNGKMYHMDLKPSNVLIVGGIMKIADFGLSKYKPDPNLSESRLNGGPKHEGIGVYCPPSGTVDDGYDVFSLGAIISELACYDIGKPPRLAEYRKKRERDIVKGQGYGSIHFYNPETRDLKLSVVQEHLDLLEIVETSRTAPLAMDMDPWQEKFYDRVLFDIVEEMLRNSADERPKAAAIARRLDMRINQASRAIRGSQPSKLDIWEHTTKGKFGDGEAPEPANRLTASIGENHCGFWLYPDAKDATVKIRRFLFDQQLQERVIEVDRKRCRPFKGVKPLYIMNAKGYRLGLIYSKDQPEDLYQFATLSEALRFQTIITGQHVYQDMSLELTQFSFFKKKMNLFPTRKEGKSPKYIVQKAYARPAHLQIWTNCEIIDQKDIPTSLDIRLVIITDDNLDRIKVTNLFKHSHGTSAVDIPTNATRLEKAEISFIKLECGIPLTLRAIQKVESYHETKHAEVRLHFKHEDDVKIFWQRLIEIQNIWSQLFPVVCTAPIMPGTI